MVLEVPEHQLQSRWTLSLWIFQEDLVHLCNLLVQENLWSPSVPEVREVLEVRCRRCLSWR